MKDVINVDTIVDKYTRDISVLGLKNKGYSVTAQDKETELKLALHSLLISKLPEKLEYPPKKNDIAQTYGASGYNQAIDDMRKSIDELFEVKG